MGSDFNAVKIHSVFIQSWSHFFRTASNTWVSMCIGILAKWLSIQCLKHIDEFSDIMKMCSWTVEVQSNYYVQRGPRGCAAMFSFIPILELREINLTEKSAFRTFSRGSSESLRRALLVRITLLKQIRNSRQTFSFLIVRSLYAIFQRKLAPIFALTCNWPSIGNQIANIRWNDLAASLKNAARKKKSSWIVFSIVQKKRWRE